MAVPLFLRMKATILVCGLVLTKFGLSLAVVDIMPSLAPCLLSAGTGHLHVPVVKNCVLGNK